MSENEYDLRKSTEKIGELYPVIVSKSGEIVDGFHRINAKANWRREVRDDIDTPEKVLKARLISNKFRRQVTAEEVKGWINDLAEIAYTEHGIEPGEISGWVAEETGYKDETVRKYLDEKYLSSQHSQAGKKGAEVTHAPVSMQAVSVVSVAEPLIREAEPTVDLESANGLKKAAKALEREANRKVKAQKTPDQLEAEKAEKLRKKQERDAKKKEAQAKKEKQLREKVRQEFTKEVKQEIKKEIKQDPVFKAEVVKEHREKILSEISHTPQTTQKAKNYVERIESTFYKVRGWGVPMILSMGKEEWDKTLPYIQGIHDWTGFLLQIQPDSTEQPQPPTLNLDLDERRVIEAEYHVMEDKA